MQDVSQLLLGCRRVGRAHPANGTALVERGSVLHVQEPSEMLEQETGREQPDFIGWDADFISWDANGQRKGRSGEASHACLPP